MGPGLLEKKRQNFIEGPGLPAQESGVCVTNESRPGRHPSGRVDSPPFNQMRPGRTETLKIAIYVTNDFLDAIYFKFETI